MVSSVSIVNKTARRLLSSRRAIQFEEIKNKVLGKSYELSVAFVGPTESAAITRQTKHKNKASNVLSFELSKTSGEIIICPAAAKPYSLAYLFIHGVCHLKGYKHGATMERIEQKLLAEFRFSIHEQTNRRH